MKNMICALVLTSIGFMGSAMAGGGGVSNPNPPSHGGGHGGGSLPSRPEAPPTAHDCVTSIFVSSDVEAEGHVELLATADHARYAVGVPVMCMYRVDSLELNGVKAQAAEPMMLESYRAGRIFLSMIAPNQEKVRLSIQLEDMHSATTLSYFVVTSFEAADLYRPLRRVDTEAVKVMLSSSKTRVPVLR